MDPYPTFEKSAGYKTTVVLLFWKLMSQPKCFPGCAWVKGIWKHVGGKRRDDLSDKKPGLCCDSDLVYDPRQVISPLGLHFLIL